MATAFASVPVIGKVFEFTFAELAVPLVVQISDVLDDVVVESDFGAQLATMNKV